MSLARGEFSAAEYGMSKRGRKSGGKGIPLDLLYSSVFIIIAVISGKSGGSNNKNISSGGLPFWLLLSMMNSGRGSHSGSWGGFLRWRQVAAVASAASAEAVSVEEVLEEAGKF